jgi:hypothetical protein
VCVSGYEKLPLRETLTFISSRALPRALFFVDGPYHYFDYDVNDNGTVRHYGTSDSDYSTDVLSSRTDEFIGYSASIQRFPY